MSPVLSFDPSGYDFIIVRHVGGFCKLEPWRLEGRLTEAMHGVVEDLFNGRGDNLAEGEFALGFIAAIDVLAHGRLRLSRAEDRSELSGTVQRAYAAMHGNMDPDRITDLMTEACETIVEHDRKRGAK